MLVFFEIFSKYLIELYKWLIEPIVNYLSYIRINKYYDRETSTLTLPIDFNYKIYRFPKGISQLIFLNNNCCYRSIFCSPIGKIPDSIKKIEFGFYFNQSIEKMSLNINELIFGECYDQPVTELLKDCNKLSVLTFGTTFNQSVNNLPDSIKYLTLGWNFSQSVDKLPKNLIGLNIYNKNFSLDSTLLKLPTEFKELSFQVNTNITKNIPSQIELIQISIPYDYNIPIDNIPINVKKIIIDSNKKHLIKKIPWNCSLILKSWDKKFY